MPQDRVATLSSFIMLSGSQKNRVDAALAILDTGIQADEGTLTGLGVLQGVRTAPLEGNEAVFKIGRTTRLTRGRVSAFEVDDVSVSYDLGEIVFDDQIEIEALNGAPFSLGGDSGSLVVDEEHRALGLLFAGNDADITYANPIGEVFQLLGVRLP